MRRSVHYALDRIRETIWRWRFRPAKIWRLVLRMSPDLQGCKYARIWLPSNGPGDFVSYRMRCTLSWYETPPDPDISACMVTWDMRDRRVTPTIVARTLCEKAMNIHEMGHKISWRTRYLPDDLVVNL